MKISIAPELVYEMSAMKAASFPEERPVAPRSKPINMGDNTPYHKSLNDHAKWVIDGCEDELISMFDLHLFDRKDESSPYRGRSKGFKTKKTQVAANGAKPSGRLSRVAKLLALLSFKLSDLAAAITVAHGTCEPRSTATSIKLTTY